MTWLKPSLGRSRLSLHPFDLLHGVRLQLPRRPIRNPVYRCTFGEWDETPPRFASHLRNRETSCLYQQRSADSHTSKSCIRNAIRPASVQNEVLNVVFAEAEREKLNEAKPLSKNAMKRLLKKERFEAKKSERRALEKAQKLEEKERKRKEWEGMLAAMSPEEQYLALKEKSRKKMARKEKSCDRKMRMKQAMESNRHLVIDLEFCDCMKPSELDSLVKQVMYAYAANAKAKVPTRLSLTGCSGEIVNHLSKASGFSNWLIHKHEQSYMEVFQGRKCDLVYLTADSECLIEKLEDSKIYIVGGLVDRNRWKGLTLEKAKRQEIATAKLPISEFLKTTGTMVLTVNQVVEIFLHYLELKNWNAAFQRVIPSRKRFNEDHYPDDTDEQQLKVPVL